MKILNAAQIKACDQFTIIEQSLSSIELMNRAGHKLFDFIRAQYSFEHYTLFCGFGNNGGDGLAIAQLLFQEKKEIVVYLLKGSFSVECLHQLELARELAIPIFIIETTDQINRIELVSATCIIDALFGIGLSRSLDGLALSLVHKINTSPCFKLAIDLPSGLSPDCIFLSDGNNTVKANETLSIQLPKLAFMFPENDLFVGQFHVIDIGLSKSFIENQSDFYLYLEALTIHEKLRVRPTSGHKGTFGHALIIAGSKSKVGASILCSKAAMRSGCGLLTVMIPEEANLAMNCNLPEAMVLINENKSPIDFTKYDAIGMGPGMGIEKNSYTIVKDVLDHYTKALVIDADALNVIAQNPELKVKLSNKCILTPHPKEFDRLTKPHSSCWERFLTQKEFSQNYNVNIILKGHYTAITTPDGQCYFNSTGNNGMATAGSGDVLTGIVTALCANGYSSQDAAIIGVYLHGYAGNQAAYANSKTAMIASDIINFIGTFFKNFE